MKLVSLDSKELIKYLVDNEMLRKSKRPCALIIKLKYKGGRVDFAVPLRSNIAPSTPKNLYFPLPPRHTTRNGFRHGIHYTKMFPVDRTKVHKFYTDDLYYKLIKSILDKSEKEIISQCQDYLCKYESGIHPMYATDIDLLLDVYHNKNQ